MLEESARQSVTMVVYAIMTALLVGSILALPGLVQLTLAIYRDMMDQGQVTHHFNNVYFLIILFFILRFSGLFCYESLILWPVNTLAHKGRVVRLFLRCMYAVGSRLYGRVVYSSLPTG